MKSFWIWLTCVILLIALQMFLEEFLISKEFHWPKHLNQEQIKTLKEFDQ